MKRLTTILSIILVTIACNKFKDVDNTHFEISDEIKAWGGFEKGSYWMYQNDLTNEISDTIEIYSKTEKDYTSGTLTIMEIDSNINPETDWIEYQNTTITSRKSGIIAGDLWGSVSVYGNNMIKWDETYNQTGINIFAAAFRLNENGVINEEFDLLEKHYSIQQIDELEVLGKTYTNIAHVTLNRVDSNDEYQYWISKNYWIIKKVFFQDGKTYSWSLKESLIKQ